MEQVHSIAELVKYKEELVKDIAALEGHLGHIKPADPESEDIEVFEVSINSKWTKSVSFTHDRFPLYGISVIENIITDLKDKLDEVNATLWEYEKLISRK